MRVRIGSLIFEDPYLTLFGALASARLAGSMRPSKPLGSPSVVAFLSASKAPVRTYSLASKSFPAFVP
jgi:hypothetical protein